MKFSRCGMMDHRKFQTALFGEVLTQRPELAGNEALKRAYMAYPRHVFMKDVLSRQAIDVVDENAFLESVYRDVSLLVESDVKSDEKLSTCSMPSFILYLVHMLDVQPGFRVLEIGAGTGWLGAILSDLVGPEGRYDGVEIIENLATSAQSLFAEFKISNGTIYAADGAAFLNGRSGCYDRIILSTSSPELTAHLTDSLKEGGILICPKETGDDKDTCEIVHLTKTAGQLNQRCIELGFFVKSQGSWREA